MQYKSPSFLPFASILLLSVSAFAETAAVSGSLDGLKGLYSRDPMAPLAAVSTFELNVTTESGKALALTFDQIKHQSWPAVTDSGNSLNTDDRKIVFVNGSGEVDGKEIPVAGAIYQGSSSPELHVNLILPGESPAPVEITVPLNGQASATFERAESDLLSGKKCGADKLPPIAQPSSLPRSAAFRTAAVAYRTIDISTDADFEFYSRYGSETNNRMAAIVNAAQTLYQEQLGIQFNIVRQRTRTTSSQPFTATESGALLDQFGTFISDAGGLAGADVAHLFTGKDIDENVIGLAWLGVICNAPDYSTSFTQTISSSLDYIVFAHEIGHNLGADHDSSTSPPSVMYPSAGSTQTTFSTQSRNEIASHVANYGSCMDSTEGTTPTPTPTPDPEPRSDPTLSFSASFNKTTGVTKLVANRSGFGEGSCTYHFILSTSPQLSRPTILEVEADTAKVTLSGRTTRRLSSSSGRIYVAAAVFGCDNSDQEVQSSTKKLAPIAQRKTSRKNKVSPNTWVSAISRALRVN